MSNGRVGRWLLIAASLVMAATVFAAIWAMGSPQAQREIRLDEKRERDLARIADVIDRRRERGEALPANLQALAIQPGQRLSISDPITAQPYAYRRVDDRAYELCAVFTTDTSKQVTRANRALADEWLHGSGRHCFQRRPRLERVP